MSLRDEMNEWGEPFMLNRELLEKIDFDDEDIECIIESDGKKQRIL